MSLCLLQMNGSVKGRFDEDKNSADVTVAVGAGDVKLRASMADVAAAKGPSLDVLSIGVEKPDHFDVDYNVSKKDFSFRFMNTVNIAEKPLNLTYIHKRGGNRTELDGTLVLNLANKVSANHVLGSRDCKLKYTYVHKGMTTFENGYGFANKSWDFALSQKLSGDDEFRAAYQTSSKKLELGWTRNLTSNGSFKISASVNLAEEKITPKIVAESTWNLEK